MTTTTSKITVNMLFKAAVDSGKEDQSRQQLYNDYVASFLKDSDTIDVQNNPLTAVYLMIDTMPSDTKEEKKERTGNKQKFASRLRRASKANEMLQTLRVRKVEGVPTVQYYDAKTEKSPLDAAIKAFKETPNKATREAVVDAMLAYEVDAKQKAEKRASELVEREQALVEKLNKLQAEQEKLDVLRFGATFHDAVA